jgi:uncharacterized membrane protein HdeD (DUF308 family)
MLFFLLGRRYPLLRLVLGLAAVVAGVLVHSVLLAAAGAVLTVIGISLTASSIRRRSQTTGTRPRRPVR